MDCDFDIKKENGVIERLKQGERSALDVLVEMYKQRGFAIAYNLVGNAEDAKDVLQEAFIKVYINIKGFNYGSRFYTWFYRIVVNCSLDLLRKRKARSRIFAPPLVDEEGKEKDIPDSTHEPAKIAMSRELAEELDEHIAGLPEKQRLCFVLKHQEGLSNQEISAVLHCNISTVKVHLFRAVRALRDRLSGYLAK